MDLDCSKRDWGLRKFRGAGEAEKAVLTRDEFRMPPAFQFCSGLACPYAAHPWQLGERAQTTTTNRFFPGSVTLPACQVDRYC